MLKELTRADWLELLHLPEERVPNILVLRGTRSLDLHLSRHRALFDRVDEIRVPNGVIDHVMIGVVGERPVGYASVYGDAMASAVTHVFGALGARLVIQTGCCGALGEDMETGDIVVVTSAYCGEGAAQYYVPGAGKIEASPGLVNHILQGRNLPVRAHTGAVWTTSALMAEGRAELERWRDLGCIGVEMETASTFAVAEHFGMLRCALLYVYDAPFNGAHLLLGSERQRDQRRLGEQAMIEAVFSYLRGPMRGI